MERNIAAAAYARRTLLGRAACGLLLLPAWAAWADAAPAEVEIHDFAFHPAVLRVMLGTTVTWVNRDDSPHSIVLQALGLRSPPLDTGARFSRAFDQAGSFEYRCGLHPQMRGNLVVQ